MGSDTKSDASFPPTLPAALVEAAPDAIVVVAADGLIVLVNRMAERLFGYERHELLGRPIEILVPDDAREKHERERRRFADALRVRPMGEGLSLQGRKKSGATIPVEISLGHIQLAEGRFVMALVRDIAHRKQLEEQLVRLSTHDALTGLYNRTFFDAERARLDSGRDSVGVIMIDVDGLKIVNDEHGHEAGDRLIRRTAAVLRLTFREEDILARVGGDEFAVLIPGVDEHQLASAADRLRQDLVRHNELTIGPPLSLSVGWAISHARGHLPRAIRLADQRMYEDKRRRKASRGGSAPPPPV